MQPDETNPTNQEASNAQPQPALDPATGQVKKQKSDLGKVAVLSAVIVGALLFALTPKSSGHGATRSHHDRGVLRTAEIERALQLEIETPDDANANQR